MTLEILFANYIRGKPVKKHLIIPLLLLVPILLIGCTAAPLEPANVEAADSVPNQRPAANVLQPAQQLAELPAQQSDELPALPPKSCPVTDPPAERFIPPEPFHEYPHASRFWYGTEALWTAVPVSRTFPMGEKVFFWRADYYWLDEPEPALTVSAKRLDAEAPPVEIIDATNGWNEDTQSFMLVGITFPTPGCWEITGQYQTDTLTFVVWVAPE
jgi:hypothetical protein